MVLDTETVFLLHFKAEIWREGEFKGGHFEIQDGRRLPWQPRWVPGFKKFSIRQTTPVPIFTLLSKKCTIFALSLPTNWRYIRIIKWHALGSLSESEA